MTDNYVRTADERVDVVWRDTTGPIPIIGLGYPVIRVWTGIKFEDAVSGAGRALEPGDLHEWASDIAAVLRESIRVAMDDAREEA